MNESDQKDFKDPPLFDDEISIIEIFNIVWEGKKLIILITSIFAIFSVVYSLNLPNYYLSESVLVSRDAQDSSALSRYSGLASIAGVSLPSSGSDPVIEMMEIIKSREFVKHLITFDNVLPSMMAVKSYDAVSQELFFDPKIYNAKTKTWTREPIKTKDSKPSYLEAHKSYLGGMLSIYQDKKTNLVHISVEHISPVFARDFLTLIIKEANALKRKKDIDSSGKALNYLKEGLSNTPLMEIKESINQLIEGQLETQMMAKINEEYSLVIIEPPFVPEIKSKPSRAITCILITMVGGMLSLGIVLIRHYLSGEEKINKRSIV